MQVHRTSIKYDNVALILSSSRKCNAWRMTESSSNSMSNVFTVDYSQITADCSLRTVRCGLIAVD